MTESKLMPVHVGVLHHKHGADIFVGWTEDEVYAKVYEYVKEWWEDFVHDRDLPEDHEEAISAYFEAAGDQEYLDMMGDTVEYPAPTDS
jgi:enoyl-[acyl-carrier-protein] reductase (NADH)